jgi:N6-adenosine-specific RNA methylase IME4
MVAAKLATLRDGQRADRVQGLPIGRASDLLNVGDRSVARAREVQGRGAPELIRAVEADKVSVSAAADIATLPVEKQREIVARGEREILKVAQRIRADKAEVRRAERIQRLAEISKGTTALPAGQRFPIIYADPPWRHEHPTFCENRRVENHYPTMELDAICALPVSDLATPDALLFIWTPAPILEQCFQVIRAWGFEYRTGLVWDKGKIGMGNYVRQQHEHLLIARRGEIPLPPTRARPSSLIRAPRGAHSEKPIEVYALIERMYPDLPKIELFARGERTGWAAWGNQAGVAA